MSPRIPPEVTQGLFSRFLLKNLERIHSRNPLNLIENSLRKYGMEFSRSLFYVLKILARISLQIPLHFHSKTTPGIFLFLQRRFLIFCGFFYKKIPKKSFRNFWNSSHRNLHRNFLTDFFRKSFLWKFSSGIAYKIPTRISS